ncbi:MAG: hypothetical protein A2176_09325 [Spirochaetes bacterium RBG_13_51_14]|nr:MAG: hypothetical protein A2176_09325 [Spirochaetes bacterium RBG_13_51_14]
MTLQVILGALVSVIGVLSAGLGLLFIIASHGIGSRLAAGAVMGGGGLVVIIVGVIMFRKGLRFSPEGIRKELLRQAKMNNGELTEEVITGALGKSDAVNFQLADLVKRGVAEERIRDNRRVYVFESFQVKLVLKKCPYCGNDYPVRDDIERCPSCGGDLTMHRTALAKGEATYSMDEDDDSGVS